MDISDTIILAKFIVGENKRADSLVKRIVEWSVGEELKEVRDVITYFDYNSQIEGYNPFKDNKWLGYAWLVVAAERISEREGITFTDAYAKLLSDGKVRVWDDSPESAAKLNWAFWEIGLSMRYPGFMTGSRELDKPNIVLQSWSFPPNLPQILNERYGPLGKMAAVDEEISTLISQQDLIRLTPDNIAEFCSTAEYLKARLINALPVFATGMFKGVQSDGDAYVVELEFASEGRGVRGGQTTWPYHPEGLQTEFSFLPSSQDICNGLYLWGGVGVERLLLKIPFCRENLPATYKRSGLELDE